MVGVGEGFFVQLPSDSAQRVLHVAKLIGFTSKGKYAAEFEEPDLPLSDGLEVLVYFEKRQEFMQQAAVIHVCDDEEGEPSYVVEPTGEPVSAESRQCYRVSTVMLDFTAELGAESDRPVLDVSATGFSVIAKKTYQVGNAVDVTLTFEGVAHRGKVSVQSVRELSKGRIRYGLHCVDDQKQGGDIVKCLNRTSIATQRLQLQRMAGAST